MFIYLYINFSPSTEMKEENYMKFSSSRKKDKSEDLEFSIDSIDLTYYLPDK